MISEGHGHFSAYRQTRRAGRPERPTGRHSAPGRRPALVSGHSLYMRRVLLLDKKAQDKVPILNLMGKAYEVNGDHQRLLAALPARRRKDDLFGRGLGIRLKHESATLRPLLIQEVKPHSFFAVLILGGILKTLELQADCLAFVCRL